MLQLRIQQRTVFSQGERFNPRVLEAISNCIKDKEPEFFSRQNLIISEEIMPELSINDTQQQGTQVYEVEYSLSRNNEVFIKEASRGGMFNKEMLKDWVFVNEVFRFLIDQKTGRIISLTQLIPKDKFNTFIDGKRFLALKIQVGREIQNLVRDLAGNTKKSIKDFVKDFSTSIEQTEDANLMNK